MKDKKFAVMIVLFVVWIIGLIAAITIGRFPKQIEYFVMAMCVGWFAYWSLSTVRSYFRKDDAPAAPPTPEPTKETSTYAKSKKNPKSS